MHIRPSSFFPPFSVIRLTQIFEIWLTLILFIWKMSIVMAFPGIHVEVLVVYLFCFLLWHQPSYFPQYWVCVNLVTMSCCFQAPWQWCYGFSLLFSDFLWFFLHVFLFSFFIWSTGPKFSAKRKRKTNKMALTLLLPARPVYDELTCLSNVWISG